MKALMSVAFATIILTSATSNLSAYEYTGTDIFRVMQSVQLSEASSRSSANTGAAQRNPGEVGSEARVWRYVVLVSAIIVLGLILTIAGFKLKRHFSRQKA